MTWESILALVAERLAVAPPFALLEQLTAALRTGDPRATASLLLADYRLTELRPVPTPGVPPVDPGEAIARLTASPVGIEAGELGRVFATQRPVLLDGAVAVPVSARGDRLGVLLVHSAVLTASDDAAQRLATVGALLGQALIAAEQVTDTYRVARRARSLSLAAEMQWDTLPGRSLDVGYASLAAQLEPAHQVIGDSYDWVVDAGGLGATLVDGSGYGTQAAGNTVFTIEALRNARREGADLVDAARLADAALFARYRGELTASAILLDLDPSSLDLRVVQAGGARSLIAGRTSIRHLPLDSHPPLGAEEDHPYTAHTVRLRPGDRVVVASDGLATATVRGTEFGARLERLVRSYRLLGTAELVRAVIRDLVAFHTGDPLLDDAVLLCLDVPVRPLDPVHPVGVTDA